MVSWWRPRRVQSVFQDNSRLHELSEVYADPLLCSLRDAVAPVYIFFFSVFRVFRGPNKKADHQRIAMRLCKYAGFGNPILTTEYTENTELLFLGMHLMNP
jgi:hypothetical protein